MLSSRLLFFVWSICLSIGDVINGQLRCKHCPVSSRTGDCQESITCPIGEICYAQVTEVWGGTFGSGHEQHYYKGCIPEYRCSLVTARLLKDDGTWEVKTPLCGACCKGDNCNEQLCPNGVAGHQPTAQVTAAPNGLKCHHCQRSARSDDCQEQVTCGIGEVCYTQVAEVAHFLDFSNSKDLHYYKGCIKQAQCSKVTDSLLQPDGTWESNRPVCGACCSETSCNMHSCHNGLYAGTTTVTNTKQTTPTTVTTPTTTTSTSTPSTTTTTTIPTTLTSTTTVAIKAVPTTITTTSTSTKTMSSTITTTTTTIPTKITTTTTTTTLTSTTTVAIKAVPTTTISTSTTTTSSTITTTTTTTIPTTTTSTTTTSATTIT